MKWVEESYAQDFHGDLVRRFASGAAKVAFLLKGCAANWNCTAEHENRRVSVHCFGVRQPDGSYTPEYLYSFDEDEQTKVMGRTSSKTEIFAAVEDWIVNKCSANDLYERHTFIEEQKRKLIEISKSVISQSPELREVACSLKQEVGDLYTLWFNQKDRACKVSFYGKNAFAEAVFLWDQCQLFRFSAEDRNALAIVLKRWLYDHSTPSALRAEFAWLNIGELATYYEQGQGVLGEFLMSWSSVEQGYAKSQFAPKEQILKFLSDLRQRGYDKTLRAGRSMHSLILSRSRRYGLREDKPCLHFSFNSDDMLIRSNLCGEQTHKLPAIGLSTEVEGLLKQLSEAKID